MTDTDQGIFSCRNICWIVGALLGVVLLLLIGGFLGLVAAIVLAVAVALVLQRLFCAEGVADRGVAAGVGTGAPAAKPADPAAAAEQEVVERAVAEAKAAENAAEAKNAAEAADAAKKAAEEKAAAEADLARKAAAEEAAAEARAAQKAAEDVAKGKATVAGDEGEGTRPEALDAPRGGDADDLKLIKGVGPKLEALLHELGFYHYDQIANWTGAEVAWVDKNLKGFKGRVSRDGWVEQARALASGAETEFSKRASESGKYEK